ncbi:hypothetical protein ABPG72_005318 [Tetrahymena utriculariae]
MNQTIDLFNKGVIIGLKLSNMSTSQIERTLKDNSLQGSRRTIERIWEEWNENQKVEDKRKGNSGRKTKLDEEDKDNLIDYVKKNPLTSITGLEKNKIANPKEVTGQTIVNTLKKEDFHQVKVKKAIFISENNKIERVSWAKKLLRDQIRALKNSIYTDETIIQFQNDRNTFQWVNKQQEDKPIRNEVRRWPEKCMVWAAIHLNGPVDIQIVEGKLDQEKYIQVLTEFMKKAKNIKYDYFVQDNAPSHRGKKVLDFFNSFKQQKPCHQNYNLQQQNPFQYETFVTFQNNNKFKQSFSQQILDCNQISFDDLQKQVQFIEFSEFNKIQDNEGIIVIQAYFNDVGELASNNLENSTIFGQRLQEIQQNILRSYPFMQIVVKKFQESELVEKKGAKYGLFEIFMCTQFSLVVKKAVIYSKDLLIQLPTSQIVLQNIQKCISTINLRVKVTVNTQENLDPLIIKTQYFRQHKPTLENIKITLTQIKKKLQVKQQNQFSSPQSRRDILNYVRSSDANILRSNNIKNIENNSARSRAVSNSISLKQGIQLLQSQLSNQSQIHTSNLNSTSLTPRNAKNTRQSSISKIESEILSKQTFSSCSKNTNQQLNTVNYSSTLNNQGQAEFNNVLSELQFYELKIHSSSYTKECIIQLDINELKIQQNYENNLDLDILIDRNDICACDIVVTSNQKGIMNGANVYVSDKPFNQIFIQNLNQGKQTEAIQLNFNSQTRRYSFYTHPGYYYVLVFHQNFYIEERQVQVNQGDNPKIDIDMKPLTMTVIRLRAFDIINQCIVPNAEILVKDSLDNLLYCGKTNELGQMECKLKFSRLFKVSISKNNEYIYFQQTVQLEMNRLVDNNHTIYLIPNSMIQNKQFEILAYFPHKKFDIDFNIRTSDGFNINKFSPNQKVIIPSCNNYYDEIELNNCRLIEFSIQNVDSSIDYDIEIYSKSRFSDKKWEDYQKQNLLNPNLNELEALQQQKKPFHKSALNLNNFFIQKRISIDLNLIKPCVEMHVLEKKDLQMALPNTYKSENSIKVFFIYNNQIQLFREINYEFVQQPTCIASFISTSKIFIEKIQTHNKQKRISNDENETPSQFSISCNQSQLKFTPRSNQNSKMFNFNYIELNNILIKCMEVKQFKKKSTNSLSSFYCLIDLLNVQTPNKPEKTRLFNSIHNTHEFSSINGETVDTLQQQEKSDKPQNYYFKDFHQEVKPARRKSQLSLMDKHDGVNSYYISRNISNFETEIGSPKESVIFGQSQKKSAASHNQSKSMINNSILNGAISPNHSRNVLLHNKRQINFSFDFLKPFSVKSCKQELIEQRNKLKEKMEAQLDVKLKKSQDLFVNLKEQLSNQIKQKKQNNIFLADNDQEPANFTIQINKQYNLSDKQLKQESINSKLHNEASLLQNNKYFRKKYKRQDAQEFMKRDLERIIDSNELVQIKQMEDQHIPLIQVREESLKCISQRNEKQPEWDSSINQNENWQEKKALFNKHKKITTEWYINSKFRGKIKEQITLEKKYPYMSNQQYLYNNLYNVQDLYPFDPYHDKEVKIQNEKKDQQLIKLINYKERLVHAPIIKELSQKLKQNNQRVPLLISDAFMKAEKKENILHI